MKNSCTRIILLLCSLMLLIANQAISAEAEVGPPFKFSFTPTFIPEGEIGCVDVVVEGFEDVDAFEFGLTYDTSIFRFDSGQTTELDPTLFSVASEENVNGTEVITVIFIDLAGGATLPDGTIAFSICFESLGVEGDLSTLAFSATIANGNPSQLFANGTSYTAPELCVVGTDVTIRNETLEIMVTPTVTEASCQNSGDGVISLDIAGGLAPYSIIVTNCVTGDVILGPEPAGNTVVVNGLDPGEYCIAVTDDNMPSLVSQTMVPVINLGPSLGARTATIEPSCNGRDDGSIEAFAFLNAIEQSNPNADFNFVWTGSTLSGQTVGSTLSNVGVGNYSVEITEISSGCQFVQQVTLTEPLAVETMVEVVNERCDTGGMDGAVAAVTTGGVGGYTFKWDDASASTDSLLTGLSQGIYTVRVEDANGCAADIATGTVSAPLPPELLAFDSISVSCPGEMDGALEVLFTDASSPIALIEWTVPGGATVEGARIENLGPGDYTVTLTAMDNCTAMRSVTLAEASAVVIDLVATTADAPECHDGASGELGALNISVTGGVAPYMTSVNGEIMATQIILSLLPGVYDVFVIDDTGCASEVVQLTIENPLPLEAEFTFIQGVTCFDGPGNQPADGAATVVVTNGPVPQYNYTWQSGENSTDAVSLMAGIQTLLISSGSCVLDTFVEIPQPAQILGNEIVSNVSCFGEGDGQIELNPTGGTGMLTISTSENLNGNIVSDLSAGTVTVIISDENNCMVPINQVITEPELLVALITDIQDITCNGDLDGLAIAASEGGTGTVSYQWSSASTDTFPTVTNLMAGDYMVTVQDVNGCIDTADVTIMEPLPIFAVVPEPEIADCFGDQTTISITQVSGGNGSPYTYTVNAGPNVPVNSDVPVFAGEYTITVFDGIGCRQAIPVTALEPPEIQVQVGVDQEINLGSSTFIFSTANSSVDIDSIYWIESPGDSTLSCYDCPNPTASPLDDSTYELFAVDVNGCEGSDKIFIEVDSDRNVYIPNVFSPNVDGLNDFFTPYTGVGVEQVLSFSIFDRWGEQVFENTNFLPGSSEGSGWDGKYRNRQAHQGIYFYIIVVEFIDGVVLTYRGNVTLINNRQED